MPTSATGWKYDPSLPAGSRPSASNWAAMYFAANRPPAGRQTPPLTRDERVDLRVRADGHQPAVRPDRCAGHEASQPRKRRDGQPLQRRNRDHRVAAPRVARHAVQLDNTATTFAHEVDRAVSW